jgi:type IV pilus assembly protein PilO
VNSVLDRLAALSSGVRLGVAAGIFAAILGAYFYLSYMPKREELVAARARLEQTEHKLAESRKTAAELPRFKEEVLRLNQELVLALAQLPEEKDIPDLLSQVSRVGQDSGLDVTSFKPGQERPEGLYASIPVEMRATGTFHQLVTFFDRVSRLPRIVTVRDVSLGQPRDVNGRLFLAADFDAVTYRFLPEAQAQQADAGKKGGKRGK